MYGLLKKIKHEEKCYQYIVRGCDRKIYCYHHNNKRDLATNERVYFTVSGDGRIDHLDKPKETGSVKGRVIQIMSGRGLAELETGEIVQFEVATLPNTPEPYQKISAIPVSPSDADAEFAEGREIRLLHQKKITNQDDARISALLKTHFAPEKSYPVVSILKCLADAGITPEQFGFSEPFCFLEQFPLTMRLDAEKQSGLVLSDRMISPNYDTARRLLQKQGYDGMTLLQKRVFSDPAFWEHPRTLILGSTSSGKTAVAMTKYLFACETAAERPKPKLLIAVNLRTLAAQMQKNIKERLNQENTYMIQLSTSEKVEADHDIRLGNVDIAIVIYEKLFLFAAKDSSFFSRYDHLIIDEAAIIEDRERGAKAEMILTRACQEQRLQVTILGTPYFNWSAYIGSLGLYPIHLQSRPLPVHELFYYPVQNSSQNSSGYTYYCADSDGNKCTSWIQGDWRTVLYTLCQEEYAEKRKTIVFCFSQSKTRSYSREIFQFLRNKNSLPVLSEQELESFIVKFLKQHGLSYEELKGYLDEPEEFEALYYGIAFHNASMPEKLRTAVEDEFLEASPLIPNGIRIMVSTDTLAYGINSNADTVIMAHMERFEIDRCTNISYNTYQNCIGRSGRLGYRTYGKSYALFPQKFEKDYFDGNTKTDFPKNAILYYSGRITQPPVKADGRLSKILSENNPDRLSLYLLSLFPEGHIMTEDQLLQYLLTMPGRSGLDRHCISDTLALLEEHCMIHFQTAEDEFEEQSGYALTPHGKNMQGFVICMEDYGRLYSGLPTLVHGEELYLFDYFILLMRMRDFSATTESLLIFSACENNRFSLKPDDQCNALKFIRRLLPKIMKKGWISPQKYQTEMLFLEKAENWESFAHTKKRELLELLAAVLISLWISGYQIKMISDQYDYPKSENNNIRRKFGEKASYYTEIFQIISKYSGQLPAVQQSLKKLSACLFFGIRYDWMCQEEDSELGTELADMMHLASMCSVRYEQCIKAGSTELLEKLKKEFQILEPKVKQILRKHGVCTDGRT